VSGDRAVALAEGGVAARVAGDDRCRATTRRHKLVPLGRLGQLRAAEFAAHDRSDRTTRVLAADDGVVLYDRVKRLDLTHDPSWPSRGQHFEYRLASPEDKGLVPASAGAVTTAGNREGGKAGGRG